jgi:hypothetical protein
MARVDQREVHQALFGYADGHRQLAASFRLSSRDLYDLGAVSDLVTGVHLRAKESYLTGIGLRESKIFALIRTWPAPEMPRPGCVWSHVLLLSSQLLASHSDLTALNSLFAHPRETAGPYVYSRPLRLVDVSTHSIRNPKIIARVISSYYQNRPLGSDVPAGPELERAVLSVWSQQWPRLRSAFCFRTAAVMNAAPGTVLRFDLQASSEPDRAPETVSADKDEGAGAAWIEAAAQDAASPTVTPLRRFLWRYGKDIGLPRRHFETLVKLYLSTKSLAPGTLPLRWAEAIAQTFSSVEDAITLKRDILGIEPRALALCPAVPTDEVLELLVALGVDSDWISDDALEARLSTVPAQAVPSLAASLLANQEKLPARVDLIRRSLTRAADSSAISDGRMPSPIRVSILVSRPDLIDDSILSSLDTTELLQLLSAMQTKNQRLMLLKELLGRVAGSVPEDILQHEASMLLTSALQARLAGTLHDSWTIVFRDRASDLLSAGALEGIAGFRSAAEAAALLDYPLAGDIADVTLRWIASLKRPGEPAEGILRTEFEAYACVLVFRSKLPEAWELLAKTLSDLRLIVLSGELPPHACKLLEAELPSMGGDSWDLNKRILTGVRELYRTTGTGVDVIASFGLPDEDLAFIFDDRKKKKPDRASILSLFWPWD